MTPSQYYQTLVNEKKIDYDKDQANVLVRFDSVHHDLVQSYEQSKTLFGRIKRSLNKQIKKQPHTKGIYIWGHVGTGKTLLVDCFYESLPFRDKQRVHFHSFMEQAHQALKKIQGEKNPIEIISKNFAHDNRVICLDEFMVTNIVDAMLLRSFLQHLFKQGVCIVATSNTKPDDLYQNGLQRELFLSAIQALNQHTHVIPLNSALDYRQRHLDDVGFYLSPYDAFSERALEHFFQKFATMQTTQSENTEKHAARNAWDNTEKNTAYCFRRISRVPAITPK